MLDKSSLSEVHPIMFLEVLFLKMFEELPIDSSSLTSKITG